MSRGGKTSIEVKLEGMKPIQSPEAERALLGAMLSEPEWVMGKVKDSIGREDFFNPAHQILFGALSDMHNAKIPIDLATVTQYLDDRRLSGLTGGPALLGDLAAGVISCLTAPSHMETVKQKAMLRRLFDGCAQIVYNIHENRHDLPAVMEAAEKTLWPLFRKAAKSSGVSAREGTIAYLDYLDRLKARGHLGYSGIPSGFDDLDQMISGFNPGELIVLAARPGVGKTALALTWARSMSMSRYDPSNDRFVKPGYRVGIVELEMPLEQLMQRLFAMHAGIDMQRLRKGKLTPADVTAMAAAAEEVSTWPLQIDCASGYNMAAIKSVVRRMVADHGVEIVIVDYLQLIDSNPDANNRAEAVGEISKGLKALALELGIAIIALAQLNRKTEEGSGEPQLHHLRESGSIEQDADVVMMISRDGGDAKIIVAKQRNGPCDTVDVIYREHLTQFVPRPRGAI
jgi:replicative DNA helicase